MRSYLQHLDKVITAMEARVLDQVTHIVRAENSGQDTAIARRALETTESILAEYKRVRARISGGEAP